MELKTTSMMFCPKHMVELGVIARNQGLSTSALVRQLIAQHLHKTRSASKK